MFRFPLGMLGALSFTAPAYAVTPFPDDFHSAEIATNGTTLHVRIGGHGPAVVLLHGFGDTGDMWAPVAAALKKDHTVIVPDLRGMGLSAHPDAGYAKKNEAPTSPALWTLSTSRRPISLPMTLAIWSATRWRRTIRGGLRKWVAIDAPLPGVGNWAAQLSNPKSWHFNFHGPDEERLVAGRERIYLDRFYNELSDVPSAIDEATRQHYGELYPRPHAMHDAFEQFVAFPQDGVDDRAFLAEGSSPCRSWRSGGRNPMAPVWRPSSRLSPAT